MTREVVGHTRLRCHYNGLVLECTNFTLFHIQLKTLIFEFSAAAGEVIAVFSEPSKNCLKGVREKPWDIQTVKYHTKFQISVLQCAV